MRIKTNPSRKTGFQPVEVTLTLESQKELDVVASLFNASLLVGLIREVCPSIMDVKVWHDLQKAGANLESQEHHYIGANLRAWEGAYQKTSKKSR